MPLLAHAVPGYAAPLMWVVTTVSSVLTIVSVAYPLSSPDRFSGGTMPEARDARVPASPSEGAGDARILLSKPPIGAIWRFSAAAVRVRDRVEDC